MKEMASAQISVQPGISYHHHGCSRAEHTRVTCDASQSIGIFIMDFTPKDPASPRVILSGGNRSDGHMSHVGATASTGDRPEHEAVDPQRPVDGRAAES